MNQNTQTFGEMNCNEPDTVREKSSKETIISGERRQSMIKGKQKILNKLAFVRCTDIHEKETLHMFSSTIQNGN